MYRDGKRGDEFAVNYEESVAYIHGKYGRGVKRGLDNMRALLQRLGNPQERLRCIHVAGTNGKGSTCAFLDAALRAAGYRVGLYTSPFLMRYNERMRIDGPLINARRVNSPGSASLAPHLKSASRVLSAAR